MQLHTRIISRVLLLYAVTSSIYGLPIPKIKLVQRQTPEYLLTPADGAMEIPLPNLSIVFNDKNLETFEPRLQTADVNMLKKPANKSSKSSKSSQAGKSDDADKTGDTQKPMSPPPGPPRAQYIAAQCMNGKCQSIVCNNYPYDCSQQTNFPGDIQITQFSTSPVKVNVPPPVKTEPKPSTQDTPSDAEKKKEEETDEFKI